MEGKGAENMGTEGDQEKMQAWKRMKEVFFDQSLAPWQKAEYIGKARDQETMKHSKE